VIGVRRTRNVELAYTAGGFTRLLPERLLAEDVRPESGLLDLSDLDRSRVRRAASTALQTHAAATRLDAYAESIPVSSAPARTLGGLWVSADHRTTLEGLFAVGGACARYFGDDTTSGTPLLAALFGAERAAEAMADIDREPSADGFDLAEERARETVERLLDAGDDDAASPFVLRRELAEMLLAGGTLDDFARDLDRARAGDSEPRGNAGLETLLDLRSVLPLARAALAEVGQEDPVRWRWKDERVEAVS
jgi:succinate dehydrogenase/fumarate reductase flavoprotein subunit